MSTDTASASATVEEWDDPVRAAVDGAVPAVRVGFGGLVFTLGVVAGLSTYATFGSSWFTFLSGGSVLFLSVLLAAAVASA